MPERVAHAQKLLGDRLFSEDLRILVRKQQGSRLRVEPIQMKHAARLILFPDEGHGSVKRSNIVLTFGHIIAFFEQQLMGKPRPE